MRARGFLIAMGLALFPAAEGGASAGAPYVIVLGIAQDGGHPQMGCRAPCCVAVHAGGAQGHLVSCLALVDPATGRRWLFDATPDLPEQLERLNRWSPVTLDDGPRDLGVDGIFLTHAHMGHYTGLMHLGREAVGARAIPIYVMPRLFGFLRENGPWSQLVRLENVELRPLSRDLPIRLGDQLGVKPLPVPHRDEYSETVGYIIEGPQASVLFIPDIDKWERWDRPLESILAQVDRAYVDGTFFSTGEVGDRAMSEIPHPFIEETLARIGPLAAPERAKVRFIHLNHTNPALDDASEAKAHVQSTGAGVAVEGERFEL